VYVLVPYHWWPGWNKLFLALPYNSGAFNILAIVIYMAAVIFVLVGLSLHQTPPEELIGTVWARARDAFRDVAIAIVFWLIVRYADRLLYYLASAHPASHRLVPHSKPELLISVMLSVAAGVAEEFVFRGYLLKQFVLFTGNVGAAILVQAALFALYHGYQQTLPVFGQHFLFGIMAALLAQWRKSLLPGMIGHAWFDAYWDLIKLMRF
jgi:membrane protease YdiL (CAAX protease family)